MAFLRRSDRCQVTGMKTFYVLSGFLIKYRLDSPKCMEPPLKKQQAHQLVCGLICRMVGGGMWGGRLCDGAGEGTEGGGLVSITMRATAALPLTTL